MASLFDEATKFVSSLTAIAGRQAYFLDVPGIDSALQLSVVEFTATEKMGEANEVRIVATHPQQLPRADYLNRDAAFRIVPDDGVPKKLSGYIERFSTIQTTKDFTKVEIIVKSHLGRLSAVTNTQIYQHQTTPDIIATVKRRNLPSSRLLPPVRRLDPGYKSSRGSLVHPVMRKNTRGRYGLRVPDGTSLILRMDCLHGNRFRCN